MAFVRSLWLLAPLLVAVTADDGFPKDIIGSGEHSTEDVGEERVSKTGAIFSDEETLSDITQNYYNKYETKSNPMSLRNYPGKSNMAPINLGTVKANSQFSTNYENMLLNDALIKESNNYPLTAVSGEDVHSRRIPSSEYILLHTISGAENVITCTKEGDFHNFWSPMHQCLICACVRTQGTLKPVCASCSGCKPPMKTPRFPSEGSGLKNYPGVTNVPEVDEIASCSPLPSGTQFQNPLHPCQVCVCTESLNSFGKPDVRIECQQSPQCVVPEDVTNLPIIPDTASPVPLPQCEKFPHNVEFPHPVEPCKMCKCIVQSSPLGRNEQQITCRPDPTCPSAVKELAGPTPGPFPGILELTTIQPHPSTMPYETVTEGSLKLPDPMSLEGMRTPGNPGPLPGPSPHESCKPFVPNQPFQHPWDECKICVCKEASTADRFNIEVDCYTKKSCCMEPPLEIAQTGFASTPVIQQPAKVPIVGIPTPLYQNAATQAATQPEQTYNLNLLKNNQLNGNQYQNQIYENNIRNIGKLEATWNPGLYNQVHMGYNKMKGTHANQRILNKYLNGQNLLNLGQNLRNFKTVLPELQGLRVNVNPGLVNPIVFGYNPYGVSYNDVNRLSMGQGDASVKMLSSKARPKSGNPDDYELMGEDE